VAHRRTGRKRRSPLLDSSEICRVAARQYGGTNFTVSCPPISPMNTFMRLNTFTHVGPVLVLRACSLSARMFAAQAAFAENAPNHAIVEKVLKAGWDKSASSFNPRSALTLNSVRRGLACKATAQDVQVEGFLRLQRQNGPLGAHDRFPKRRGYPDQGIGAHVTVAPELDCCWRRESHFFHLHGDTKCGSGGAGCSDRRAADGGTHRKLIAVAGQRDGRYA
jgi:hypothetical protein